MAPKPETQPEPETPANPTLDNCPDCHTRPGRFHLHGCDIARCALTGLPRAGCVHGSDVCNTRWTGLWPGEAECIEYGFVLTFGDDPVREHHPDLNRLYRECDWDRDQQRMVRRTTP
ncbi:hypothetical protein [Streptomyces sp. NBC_01022]|uniref:hypothetical protein n=1 Tax=Streptomyces sp. NBC_01022 TaxID=2903723 RepID=UPI002DDABAB6|nr:hypothetical protein [Streptomyces sp. NBC_01022]WRZ82608.1 hypothetical protein OG316_21285 [Streptomyces sp. NBC_01022]